MASNNIDNIANKNKETDYSFAQPEKKKLKTNEIITRAKKKTRSTTNFQKAIKDFQEINEMLILSQKFSQNKINELTDPTLENNKINLLYAEITDSYGKLETKYKLLETDHNQKLKEHDAILVGFKNKYDEDINNLKNIISKKDAELEQFRLNLNNEITVKENDFVTQIEKVRSEYINENSEMESRMQKLLDEANNKLREVKQSNSVLRAELMACKNQYSTSFNINESEYSEKFKKLEDELYATQLQLKIANEKLKLTQTKVAARNIEVTTPSSCSSKNLDVNNKYKTFSFKNKQVPPSLPQVENDENSGVISQQENAISTITGRKNRRKRKLFNPQDLDYLNNLQ